MSIQPRPKARFAIYFAIIKKIELLRHLIENFFAKLKEFKAIDLRCERINRKLASMVYA